MELTEAGRGLPAALTSELENIEVSAQLETKIQIFNSSRYEFHSSYEIQDYLVQQQYGGHILIRPVK